MKFTKSKTKASAFSPIIAAFQKSIETQDLSSLSGLLDDSLAEYYLALFKTQDQFMLDQKELVLDLATNPVADMEPVIITGPTGTGKELFARALHGSKGTIRLGPNLTKTPVLTTFAAVNCAAITDTLIDAELFGSVKGSFTGSTGDKTGLLAAVHDGTVFLDEIGDLPINAQAKLLRAIQEREVRPVGSTSTVPITSRIIAATKYNLEDRIKVGLFRDDLYARLSVFTVKTTPLKDRPLDIAYILKEAFGFNEPPPDWYIKEEVNVYNVRALYNYVKRCQVLGKSWLKREKETLFDLAKLANKEWEKEAAKVLKQYPTLGPKPWWPDKPEPGVLY